MLMQWSKDLAVGHPIVDYDHQMLINLANDFHFAVENGSGEQAVAAALERLVQYVESHFKREEQLFMNSNYPDKAKHQQNHRDIENMVRAFQASYAADPASIDLNRLLDFFKVWLIKHIGKLDRGYMPYVKTAEHKQGNRHREGFV